MIDVHAHYVPPRALTEVARHARTLGVSYSGGDRTLTFPSGPSRPLPVALTDLDQRRTWNGQRGIVSQVLSPWMDVTGDDLPPDSARAWARLLNDAVAEDIAGDASFRAFATLPVADGAAAAEELRRCVEEAGFVGAALPTQVMGSNLDGAGLDAVFEAADALDVPVFLHPFRVLAAERMRDNYLANACGNPFETTLAAMCLFFAGLFDRHPRLRVLLAHCGGTLPLIAGRAAHASQWVRVATRVVEAPDDILRCYFYDTLLHDPAALGFAIVRVGPERVALGTDVPFPMRIDDPGAHLHAALAVAGLPEDGFRQISERTPARLLRGVR